MTRCTSAMVLAAGLGTRMRELTREAPKPMVRLSGRTLVDRVLDRLADAGIQKAVVNLHYHADLLEGHLGQRTAPRMVFSDERGVLLDTGGGIKRALPSLGDGPFVVHNSDSVWIEGARPRNLDRLMAMWDPERMDALLMVALASQSIGYTGNGDFSMDAGGRLERRGERTVVPFVFTGVSIADARLFEDTPDGAFSLNVPWDRALARGRLYGMRHDGIWMHVGTPEALAEAEAEIAASGG